MMERKKKDWSGLHCDFLILIFNFLPLVDRLRVKAVCLSWNAAAKLVKADDIHSNVEVPWLMLTLNSPFNGKLKYFFFNIQEKKIYHELRFTRMVGVEDFRCVGSHNGWLVMLSSVPKPKLVNPFRWKVYELPSILTLCNGSYIKIIGTNRAGYVVYSIDDYHQYTGRQLQKFIFRKTVLSIDEKNKDYLLVVVYHRYRDNIAFCRKGDVKWSELDTGFLKHMDEVFGFDVLLKDYQLYIVCSWGVTEVWDMKGPVPSRTKVIELPKTKTLFQGLHFAKVYALYSSEDEVFMVLRYREIDRYQKTVFSVYRVDLASKVWEKVKSLGDRALFVGQNQSMCLVSRKANRLRQNSIYFTGHGPDVLMQGVDIAGDVGVYDMQNGTVTVLVPAKFVRGLAQQVWVVPNMAVV